MVKVGESASARTYSASRDNSDPSNWSDVSAILGEGRLLLLLEAWGRPAGDFGRECRDGSEDLRRAFGLSRFEKKPRKLGAIGKVKIGRGR